MAMIIALDEIENLEWRRKHTKIFRFNSQITRTVLLPYRIVVVVYLSSSSTCSHRLNQTQSK